MKSKLSLFIVIILIANISFCQEYFPLVKENAVWNITNVNFAIEPWDSDSYTTNSLRIYGDTTINSLQFKKLWTVNCFDETFIEENSTYYAAIREDSKSVFLYKDDEEFIIYDFSLQVGDSFTHYSFFSLQDVELEVESIETIILNGVDRKKINFIITNDYSGWVKSWIEGIGSEAGLIDYAFYHGNFDVYLNCYKENNSLVYPEISTNCCLGVTDITNSFVNTENVEIFPNPTSDIININGKNITKIQIIDLNGCMIYSQNTNSTINKVQLSNFSKGFYLLEIHQSNKIINKKLVIE